MSTPHFTIFSLLEGCLMSLMVIYSCSNLFIANFVPPQKTTTKQNNNNNKKKEGEREKKKGRERLGKRTYVPTITLRKHCKAKIWLVLIDSKVQCWWSSNLDLILQPLRFKLVTLTFHSLLMQEISRSPSHLNLHMYAWMVCASTLLL